MKAIIVDDEPKAIELLKSYLQHFSGVELVSTFRNGLKAFEFLSTEHVDLIFLDINMPHISGISLSKMINRQTNLIFTTAYSEYAVESYEVQAIDYLLKPISLERLTQAMSKVLTKKESGQVHGSIVIQIKSGATIHLVKPEDILYLEKDGNYITYHTDTTRIIARESTQESLDHLPDYFLQVHRSFIVNLRKLTSIQKETVLIGKTEIPVGASFSMRLANHLRGL
ncbi:MAG: DNA-binding response regulator [Ekhidna sp.]|uniref:LytR/AlgR family response regulator transcription factor n=1 Tax=Ekhidna sp. TaxID=2608089 RepID=UPI0032EAC751